MLAAIGTNDCNWDDAQQDEIEIYPDLFRYQSTDTYDAWFARYEEILERYDDTLARAAASEAATGAGADFGLHDLDKNCPVIDAFAAKFLDGM